ncbi:hypothetical protein V8C42DRAFT_337655 [Trichoderma barbatum]
MERPAQCSQAGALREPQWEQYNTITSWPELCLSEEFPSQPQRSCENNAQNHLFIFEDKQQTRDNFGHLNNPIFNVPECNAAFSVKPGGTIDHLALYEGKYHYPTEVTDGGENEPKLSRSHDAFLSQSTAHETASDSLSWDTLPLDRCAAEEISEEFALFYKAYREFQQRSGMDESETNQTPCQKATVTFPRPGRLGESKKWRQILRPLIKTRLRISLTHK